MSLVRGGLNILKETHIGRPIGGQSIRGGIDFRSTTKQKLSGLYLVADLSYREEKLLDAVSKAVRGGVQIVQIWNVAGKASEDTLRVGKKIHSEMAQAEIPLIVNNDLDLAEKLGASGIHFDDFHTSAEDARRLLGADAIVGYTCGNDQALVRKAENFGADYISFCAVFPSPSVHSCEIVPLESVRQAKHTVSISVFASGGITLENAHLVMEASADGLAIASSILRAENPETEAKSFRKIIDRYLADRAP
jgi:thiamine-phosphate pyrophosphorylase